MGTLIQDLSHGLRMLCKSPGFTAIAAVTLALGIGANTASLGLANAAFFRVLPYPHAERLAFLCKSNKRAGVSEGAVSYPDWADWCAQSRSFKDMAFIDNGAHDKLLQAELSRKVSESKHKSYFWPSFAPSRLCERP
jgi:hypothetical protein